MDSLEKIKRSWWVIISFILFLNGFGFVYIGFKHNNKNWILEGIAYEIPYFIYFIVFSAFNVKIVNMSNPTGLLVAIAFILMLVSIVRSIWVAVKLADVYEYSEKYAIKKTNLKHSSTTQKNEDSSSKFTCCICLICIFLFFAILAIL